MVFKKGNHPKTEFKKGHKHSEETKEKLREATLKNSSKFWLGKHLSEKVKKKISESHKGMKKPWVREYMKGRASWNKGKKGLQVAWNKGKKQSEKMIKVLRNNRSKQIFPLKDTKIEVKIQNFLKKLGIEFFTHQHINIKHGYQCDILIPSMNIIIECDGNYWHKYPIGNDIDHIRTKELIEKGFKVLRLWEFEIKDMKLNDFKERLRKNEE